MQLLARRYSLLSGFVSMGFVLLGDLLRLLTVPWRSRGAMQAEILFLRKQLAVFVERGQRPRHPTARERLGLVLLSRLFDWHGRAALVAFQPATLIRWHRLGFRLLWKRRSQPGGRPSLPVDLRRLILRMAEENPTWGQERIAHELSLKLGIAVSPRTVRKYVRRRLPGGAARRHDQRWSTFVRNHAKVTLACDFFTEVTACFRVLHVFVVMEVGSRRILRVAVTEHPNAHWTLQQLREVLPFEHDSRFLIHDRDARFAPAIDDSVEALGVEVLTTPPYAPQANAFCERLIGTIRRECLDFVIPLGEEHLRRILREWAAHYNRGRPHASLGPGLPERDPSLNLPPQVPRQQRHRLPVGSAVTSRAILGGLHHEYRVEKLAA